jgi:KilA-N domain
MTKKICDIKNYASLISLAQFNRPKHIPCDFVRVDLWGKEFGEKWEFKDYKRQAESKRYQKRLLERESLKVPELVLLPGRGSKDGTWVHPLIASHYASWLSADFAILVNQTFLRVMEGDSDLAAEMMIRDHNKDRQEKALKRVKVAISNKKLNDLSHKHGLPYHKAHDDRNVGLYGQTTKQLRVAGNVEKETPLNYLSDLDISYADAANGMVADADNPALMALAAGGIAELHKRITGHKLEPRWDKERLTPAKARKITHSANYQMEIPV